MRLSVRQEDLEQVMVAAKFMAQRLDELGDQQQGDNIRHCIIRLRAQMKENHNFDRFDVLPNEPPVVPGTIEE